MKRYIVLPLLAVLTAGLSICAHSQVLIGLEAGGSYSHLRFQGQYYYNYSGATTSASAILRPVFALKLEAFTDASFRVYTGLRYTIHGGSYSPYGTFGSYNTFNSDEEYRSEYSYLEIPVGVKAFISGEALRWYLGVGMTAGIIQRAESFGPPAIEEPVVDLREYSRDVVPFIDFLTGLEYNIGPVVSVYVEARYTQSIISVEVDPSPVVTSVGFIISGGVLIPFSRIF